MTDNEILALAEKYGLAIGVRPQPQLVTKDKDTLHFVQPPGLTYYGEKLLAFSHALLLNESKGSS